VNNDDQCVSEGMTAFQVSTEGIGLRSFTSSPSYIVEAVQQHSRVPSDDTPRQRFFRLELRSNVRGGHERRYAFRTVVKPPPSPPRPRGAIPNCTPRAPWWEAHHTTYWSHGGPTGTGDAMYLSSTSPFRLLPIGTPVVSTPPHSTDTKSSSRKRNCVLRGGPGDRSDRLRLPALPAGQQRGYAGIVLAGAGHCGPGRARRQELASTARRHRIALVAGVRELFPMFRQRRL
jgi:hypothetical protein